MEGLRLHQYWGLTSDDLQKHDAEAINICLDCELESSMVLRVEVAKGASSNSRYVRVSIIKSPGKPKIRYYPHEILV